MNPPRTHPTLFSRSAVIVCEPTPYWTPELQRQFQGPQWRGDADAAATASASSSVAGVLAANITVKGCRNWSQMTALSQNFGASVEIVDFTIPAAEIAMGLARRLRTTSPPPLIALLPPSLAELKWRLREAGAETVFVDLPPGEELARICLRWLGRVVIPARRC